MCADHGGSDLDVLAARSTSRHDGRRSSSVSMPSPGSVWRGGQPGRSGYVSTNELGEPYRPAWLSDQFDRDQSGLGLPRLVFHGVRHTSATILLAALVPVHVVSERLGHPCVSVTLDIYAHVIPTQGADAATIRSEALYGTGTDG